MSFSSWAWLVLALMLPLGAALASRRRLRLPLPATSAGPRLRRPLAWYWTPVLRGLVLVLLIAALANPERAIRDQERRSDGISIVLALDISSSMLAEDFEPDNRIAVAKRELARFAEGRGADRLALVAFAGEALTVVPGTLDHGVLLQAVGNLDVGQLEDGTAIGTALATAVNRVGEERGSRVVVLLTDGDNNRGQIEPLEAAAAARALGVRVYTIGVGRRGTAPVPIGRTRFGYQYANMEVNVNDALLEAMAEATGGLYFRATDPAALAEIYERIDALETAPLEERRKVERVSARADVLLLALGALLLELIGAATRARRIFGA
ncbi:MAG: VWA domain-containing protein [Gemmatimonadota bacterium]